MKKIMSLIAILAVSHVAFAQKCRFTVDKKDPFTGERVVSAKNWTNGWSWASGRTGNQLMFEMSFMMAGENQRPLTPTDTVLIKLADGSIVKLNPSSDAVPVIGSVSTTSGSQSTYTGRYTSTKAKTTTTTISTYSPVFKVDRAVFEKFSQSVITTIRLNFTGQPLDFDLSVKPLSKIAPDIMAGAKCVLQTEP